ncbi:MAG: hypothetical protein ACRC37_07415 [Lentisphaeria bacterium]
MEKMVHSKKCFKLEDSAEELVIVPASIPFLKTLIFSFFIIFVGSFFAYFIKIQPQSYNRYFYFPLIFSITAVISHVKQVIIIYRHERKLGTILHYDKKNDIISLPREKISFKKGEVKLVIKQTFYSHGPESSLLLEHNNEQYLVWTTLKGEDFFAEIMAALA